jgi:hypothetical protein
MLQTMKHHSRLWIALTVAVVLIAGHGVILYYVSSHMALSAAIAGVIALVVVKHLGLFGSLYALVRKALRRQRHVA